MGRPGAHSRRGPGDGNGRGAHGRLDGPRGPRQDAGDGAGPLLVARAAGPLAKRRDVRTHPARRRRLCGLRSRHPPGPGAPGRSRLPHGGADLLLHPARGGGARAPVAQGGATGRLLHRVALRARRGADLPEDRRGGDRGGDGGPRRRGRRARRVGGGRSLVSQHGPPRLSRHPAAPGLRRARAAPRGEEHGMRSPALAPMAFPFLALVAAGCSAGRIESGVYYSSKGYHVSLPPSGWSVTRGGAADLELQRMTPPGGMLADATCEGKETRRPLDVLTRHLTFGLKERVVEESGPLTVGGRPAQRAVLRGSMDGTPVEVEAIVVKGDQCVYDFLYVAPPEAFESGREDFRAFVESVNGSAR